MNTEFLDRWIKPLKIRVMQSISRAVIGAIRNDRALMQAQVQLLADELHSNVDILQQYGFASIPQNGAEGIFLSVGGSRESGVIIATEDRRFRIKTLAPGEVALYTDEGDKVIFGRGNKIAVTSLQQIDIIAPVVNVAAAQANVNASGKAKVSAPTLELVASAKVTATTPLLEVSGLVSCAGIGVGAAAQAGKAVVAGSLTATGDLSDSKGSLAQVRTVYNGHTHPETGTTTQAPNQGM